MNTNDQNKSLVTKVDKGEEKQKNQKNKVNTTVGGHTATSEKGGSSEERIATQARRAEQPEPDAKDSRKKDTPSTSASSEIVNNTGDDADMADADAATG